jgi:hypothetical protein
MMPTRGDECEKSFEMGGLHLPQE